MEKLNSTSAIQGSPSIPPMPAPAPYQPEISLSGTYQAEAPKIWRVSVDQPEFPFGMSLRESRLGLVLPSALPPAE